MVLSTTKPVETISAISEKLFRLKPRRYMTPKVPSSDSGTQMVGTSVALKFRRNRNTTTITRMVDRISVISTSCTALRMEVVVSVRMLRSTETGSAFFSSSIWLRMESTTWMTLAPGCLVMLTRMAGLPLKVPRLRTFSTPSTTSATSPSRTAEPLRYATMSVW